MRAQVITDDMQRLLLGLACDEIFQKRNELCAGVAGASLANHLAAGGMERRVQRERPVAVILKAMSFGPAGESGKTRSNRSSPWMALFSSTQKTAALSGGLR